MEGGMEGNEEGEDHKIIGLEILENGLDKEIYLEKISRRSGGMEKGCLFMGAPMPTSAKQLMIMMIMIQWAFSALCISRYFTKWEECICLSTITLFMTIWSLLVSCLNVGMNINHLTNFVSFVLIKKLD